MPSRKGRERGERLAVFMNGVAVGRLDRAASGGLSFAYDKSWLERAQSMPISRRFPLRLRAYTGGLVEAFFDNLLPENSKIRELVAARARAAGTKPFDLLSAIGRDCVGALQFYPGGQDPGGLQPPDGRAVSKDEIADIIRNLSLSPLGIRPDSDFRISLAGAQNKTALLRRGGRWHEPKGATPTTHIIKPSIGVIPHGPDLTLSVENEWLCLKILGALGLPAAEAEMEDFGGLRALVVTRFDRSEAGGLIYRLPQEDVCQALGVPPHMKYESDGGPGMRSILALLNESDQRDLDRSVFIKSQITFWMLAAIDGHAKNFSLFIRPSGFVLTPLYDVISADPVLNPRTLPKQKIKLAMAVGTNRHYKINEIRREHWIQTAKLCRFDGIEDVMEELSRLAPGAVEKVARLLPPEFPASVSDPIFESFLNRAKKLA